MFTKTRDMLADKNLNKFKKIKVLQSIFSYHNRIKLEMNSKTFKYLETTQYTPKEPTGERRKSKEN